MKNFWIISYTRSWLYDIKNFEKAQSKDFQIKIDKEKNIILQYFFSVFFSQQKMIFQKLVQDLKEDSSSVRIKFEIWKDMIEIFSRNLFVFFFVFQTRRKLFWIFFNFPKKIFFFLIQIFIWTYPLVIKVHFRPEIGKIFHPLCYF